MTKTFRTVLMKCLLAGALAVMVMWVTAGPIFGFAWHLLHHSNIEYRGVTISVPGHSYVRHTSLGPCIWTLSAGAPLFNRPYASTLVSHSVRPFSKDKDYSRFADAMAQSAGRSGHTLVTSQTVSLGGRSAFCLEFARADKQPRSLLRCAIDGSDIFVSYEGDPRFLSDVFDILHSMFPPLPPANS
jgi:hypothetical protein